MYVCIGGDIGDSVLVGTGVDCRQCDGRGGVAACLSGFAS